MHNTGQELKNIFNFSISTWVNFLVGFVSTFILTRIFMPDVLGVINLFYTTVMTLMSFFCFGLDSALIRFFYSTPRNVTINTFIFNLIIPCLIAVVLIGGVSVMFWGQGIAGFFLGKRDTLLCVLMVVSVIDQVALRYLNIIYRMETRIKDFNIQSIVINIVTKLSVILGVLVDATTPIYALLFNVLAVSLVAVYYSYLQRCSWQPSEKPFDYSAYEQVFKFAFWGWASMFVLQVYNLSSQLIVNNTMDLHAVGIFTSAGIFTAIVTAARGGFCTYWSAFMYKKYADPDKQLFIRKMHDVITLACIVLCVLLFAFRSILYLFIGEEYRSSMVFFSLLLYFPLLQTVQETTGYGINIKNKNYLFTIIYSITLVINVGLSLLWVKEYGLTGVAMASFVSAVFSFCLISVIGQRLYYSINKSYRSILGAILLLIIGIIPVYISNDFVLIAILAGLLSLALFLYREVMLYAREMIINKLGTK